jgi:hypothetical protein
VQEEARNIANSSGPQGAQETASGRAEQGRAAWVGGTDERQIDQGKKGRREHVERRERRGRRFGPVAAALAHDAISRRTQSNWTKPLRGHHTRDLNEHGKEKLAQNPTLNDGIRNQKEESQTCKHAGIHASQAQAIWTKLACSHQGSNLNDHTE